MRTRDLRARAGRVHPDVHEPNVLPRGLRLQGPRARGDRHELGQVCCLLQQEVQLGRAVNEGFVLLADAFRPVMMF